MSAYDTRFPLSITMIYPLILIVLTACVPLRDDHLLSVTEPASQVAVSVMPSPILSRLVIPVTPVVRVSVFTTPSPTLPPHYLVRTGILGGTVYLRSGPGINYPAIGYLTEGQVITPTTSLTSTWVDIGPGWINARYIGGAP